MADFLKVDEILQNLIFKEDMQAAEFGCGSAAFAVALARKMPKGRVHALDIQEEKLSALKGRLSAERLTNLYTVLCDLEATRGSKLPDATLDIIVIPNVLFQAHDKNAILKEAQRVLKSGGQLLIVDWLKRGSFGPKGELVSLNEVKTMAESLHFHLKREFQAGEYHYGLLFIK